MNKRTPQRARCIRTPSNEVECTIPHFHPVLIAMWKKIPAHACSYDPVSKASRFWGGVEERATVLLLKHFPDAGITQGTRTRGATPTRLTGRNHFHVLHLRETAPVELIEASYRVLARLHHPDAGGTHEAMQAINTAYAQLKERVRA
jgi:hypothetical protein